MKTTPSAMHSPSPKTAGRAGFTLIEMLVVAGVFAVAFLLATTMFARVQSNQRGIAGRQRIVADGRYLLEAMARTVRLGAIDYKYYRNPDDIAGTNDPIDLTRPAKISGASILVVRDPRGDQTCYRWEGPGKALQTVTVSNSARCDGTWTDITPSDVVVTNFQVLIAPVSDPFLGTRTSVDCKNASGLSADGACPCNDALDGENDTDDTACLPQQRCVAQRPSEPISTANPEICLNVNQQPAVTLVLETKNNTIAPGERSSIALQTTVTPRTLRR